MFSLLGEHDTRDEKATNSLVRNDLLAVRFCSLLKLELSVVFYATEVLRGANRSSRLGSVDVGLSHRGHPGSYN